MNNCCHIDDGGYLENSSLNNTKEIKKSNLEFIKHDRNSNLIALLCESPNIEVSFQGLKRKLGWHQEILARSLKRLEKDGIVNRTSSGLYKLNNCDSIHNYPVEGMFQEGGLPVTQLWVPLDLSPDTIISKLKNTWFGSWRWYSYKDLKSGKILTWISENDNIWVNLRFRDNAIFIESGPVEIFGREKCIHSCYELLKRLMQLFNNKISEPKRILQPN